MRDFTVPGLLDRIAEQPAFRDLVRDMAAAGPGTTVGPLGLPEAARPAVVAAVSRALRRPILWITPQPDDARTIAEALRAFLAHPERIRLLPAPDALPFERVPWDPMTREARMSTLAALYRWRTAPEAGTAPIVVASMRGLLVRTLSPEAFAGDARVVARGDRLDLTGFLARLDRLGYEIVTSVTVPGEMAHRGGIVDVFPPSEAQPIRLEWFGDEVDSLRRFDPTSQRSSGTTDSVVIVPAAEALPGRGPEVAAQLADLEYGRLHPLAESEMRRQREDMAAGQRFAGIEFYGSLLHPSHATALAHLPPGSWVVCDSLARLEAAAHGAHGQARTVFQEQVEAGELPRDWPGAPLDDWSAVEAGLAGFTQLVVGQLGAQPASTALGSAFGASPRFGGRIEEAVVEAIDTADAGHAVVVVSRQAPRIVELLGDLGVSLAETTELRQAPTAGGIAVVHGALTAGWTLETDGCDTVLLTDGELFGWRVPHSRRRAQRGEETRAADFFAELTPGDFVVHIEHGIGVFRGLTRQAVGETEREYLQIEYAQGDMLYVPTHQADRVARYVGAGDASPAVSRLGAADWEKAKQRARRAIEDIAHELLELYARRAKARRAAFAPDTAWQAEMEAAFPFIETEDQLRAIEDVKRDMESERPMDRLVVGDVGFGKTEVALRAAFKAVMGGKQVAILAPTTVLAQQHYETFRQRLRPFPVRIEMLSRFRSRSEQKDIMERLATRELDIVVGTHRLLSPDITFNDLGLLVIDEEHKFGVKHKERLRELRAGVDTLTLTATPIPRTMHLALSGLRDLTTIDTPPQERLPVVTHIGPYDDHVARQAIRRELARRGQVFYVFNRVQGIEFIARKVERLVPEASLCVAHGQMKEHELAQAMLDFVGGVADVLVCTSIIESGLDIQNANTLIVERADRFGLAQLHQLRGRVGRSAQRAYAYFLHAPGHEIPAEASARLEALAEASDLGAGFRLAMRDLEIRGAGDILGARQHGHVTAIGLDLYTRLLAEAITKLRADGPERTDTIAEELADIDPGTLPTVDLPLDAYLPEDYVAETRQRTRIYRRMAAIDTLDDVDDVERELVDRFGRPPAEVQNLIDVLRLRVLAHLAGAESIGREGQVVAVSWNERHALRRSELKLRLDRRVRIGRHRLSLPVEGTPERWLPWLRATLERAAEVETRGAGA